MKWIDLEVGDVLIDEEDHGNDYILVERFEESGRWLEFDDGDVLECFTVYRGHEILQRGME